MSVSGVQQVIQLYIYMYLFFKITFPHVLCLVAQSCPTLCNPMDCSYQAPLPMGNLQKRILEWVAMPFSRESSQPRDRIQVSCIAGRFFICSPGGLPDPAVKIGSPTLQVDYLPAELPRKSHFSTCCLSILYMSSFLMWKIILLIEIFLLSLTQVFAATNFPLSTVFLKSPQNCGIMCFSFIYPWEFLISLVISFDSLVMKQCIVQFPQIS